MPGSSIQDLNCVTWGRARPSVPETRRVHVSVCVSVGERRGAYHALPPVRIAGEPNPRASWTAL